MTPPKANLEIGLADSVAVIASNLAMDEGRRVYFNEIDNMGRGAEKPNDLLSSLMYGDNMMRTQVSLDEREYALAKTEARTLGISIAEFVRRAVREALPPRGEGPWMKFAGFVETGDARSSRTVDEIVYGQKD